MREQSHRCVSCGTSSWEWEHDPNAYHPEEEFCVGCYLKQVASDTDGNSMPGTTVTLYPKGASPKKLDIVGSRRAERRRKKT